MREPYRKYVKALLNLMAALAILLFTIFVLPRIIGFFMPFVVAWMIAAIANPLVRFLDEKIKIRRKAGSAIVIVSVIAAIIGGGYWLGAILIRELLRFGQGMPELWGAMMDDVTHAGHTLEGLIYRVAPQLQTQLESVISALSGFMSKVLDNLGTPTVTAVGNFAKNLPAVFVAIIMCLLASYFFVAEREEVIRAFYKYLPRELHKKWELMNGSLKKAVGGYFKAQFKIGIWMYLLLLIGFLILKIEYSAVIALGIAVLDFFPVFGTGTVLIPWAVVQVLSGNYKMALGLGILWCGGQLARQLIQPKIVGDTVGLPALPTIFLIYIGYKVGSVGGMILAVPVGIILANMYQAGFFETTVDSLRILIGGFNRFRSLTEEDRKDFVPKKEEEK